jgi:FkbM family methyltransferase
VGWRTSSLVIALRSVARVLGINRLIAGAFQTGYEANYDARLTKCISLGDTVWDIGANVGLYTVRFANRVGASGLIVAFEPSKVNFLRLAHSCESLQNVKLQPFGLGEVNGQIRFQQGTDDLGATSRVSEDSGVGEVVEIRVGDDLIAAGLAAPNIIKLDVEGFEGEVLNGLSKRLLSPELIAVGVEVHFGILQDRGRGDMPRQIEQMLRNVGFRIEWPDVSHILATRSV